MDLVRSANADFSQNPRQRASARRLRECWREKRRERMEREEREERERERQEEKEKERKSETSEK